MLVACRLAGLSALGDPMRASNDAQCGGRHHPPQGLVDKDGNDVPQHHGVLRLTGGGKASAFPASPRGETTGSSH